MTTARESNVCSKGEVRGMVMDKIQQILAFKVDGKVYVTPEWAEHRKLVERSLLLDRALELLKYADKQIVDSEDDVYTDTTRWKIEYAVLQQMTKGSK